MLGLRHYKGLAIDLWQGNFLDFSTDTLILSFSNVPQDQSSQVQESNFFRFQQKYQRYFDFDKIKNYLENEMPEMAEAPEALLDISKYSLDSFSALSLKSREFCFSESCQILSVSKDISAAEESYFTDKRQAIFKTLVSESLTNSQRHTSLAIDLVEGLANDFSAKISADSNLQEKKTVSDKMMSLLKEAVDSAAEKIERLENENKRFTFLVGNKIDHDLLQESLFAVFPERKQTKGQS